MSSHIQNFFINNQITHVFVHLVAYVFHGHDLTTPTSYFLIPACIFFLVTHLIKVPTNVLISSLTNSLFLVMFNLMSQLSPLLLPLILPLCLFSYFPPLVCSCSCSSCWSHFLPSRNYATTIGCHFFLISFMSRI